MHKVSNPRANLHSGKAIPADKQLKAGLDVAFLNESRNFDGAQTACQTLGAGWHAPASERPRATPRAMDHSNSLEGIISYFVGVAHYWFWSSSTVSSSTGDAWGVNLADGYTYYDTKHGSYSVVCVRP